MEKKAKKSHLAGIPAWAMSLMIFFVTIGLFELSEYIDLSKSVNTDILALVAYVILLTASCFIICKTHPKSVWYTPLICNAFNIIILVLIVLDYEARLLPYVIAQSGLIVLSVVGAIVGAKIGRRLINQVK
jgi:hypothetical protein